MALKTGTKAALRGALASLPAGDDMMVVFDELAKALDHVEYNVLDEVVTLTNAVENNLSIAIPANAVIIAVCSNNETLIVGDATGDNLFTKVGIGVTADPDKYGLTADLLKNSKSSWAATPTRLTTAEQICVKAAQTSGAAATEKFVAGGLVRVRVVYLTPTALPDAA